VTRPGIGLHDGQEEVLADEGVHLAELHLLRSVPVHGGLQHGEERRAVPLQLRTLVPLGGVLDRQFVQAERHRDVAELDRVGPVQHDAHRGAVVLEHPEAVVERAARRRGDAVHVHGVQLDGHGTTVRTLGNRWANGGGTA